MSKIAVMAFSGGMDSTGLLVHLLAKNYEVHTLSYDYGQKHKLELERAKSNIQYLLDNDIQISHKIVDLQSAMSVFHSALTTEDYEIPEGHYEEEQMKQTVVPNRNAIFASILYGYALSIALKKNEKVKIALGVHSGDHEIYPDCRPEFYDALENAFKIGNWESDKVAFYLPYLEGDKETILIDAEISLTKLKLDFDIIFANTNTSYNPDDQGRSSGRSGADIERILAFNAIGRKDPVSYIDNWTKVLEHAIKTGKKHKEKI
ncbi:MAG: 7-cyano-7-deazaguanine synthase [Candidatus Poseidoniales archaeon]